MGSSEKSPEPGDLIFMPEDFLPARAIAFWVATLTLLVAFFVVASKTKGIEWDLTFYQSLGRCIIRFGLLGSSTFTPFPHQ